MLIFPIKVGLSGYKVGTKHFMRLIKYLTDIRVRLLHANVLKRMVNNFNNMIKEFN